jgi:hypothetical protein
MEEFTSKVQNSPRPVFIFCLSIFYNDFSPAVKQFAETHSHLAIYGIDGFMLGELCKLGERSKRFRVPSSVDFIFWKDGEMVVHYTAREFSGLMAILQAMGETRD